MFTAEHTPRYGDTVMLDGQKVVVKCFMGVLADEIYGTKDAWASVQYDDGRTVHCSLYDLQPCK
jgi:methylthioribose-1-phosphate isomerase